MTSTQELRDILQYNDSATTARTPGDIGEVLLGGLVALVGADSATLTQVDLHTGDELAVQWPTRDPATLRDYPRVAPGHPLRPPVRDRLRRRRLDAPPLRISDVLTRRQWRNTPLWATTHREVADQLTMPLALSGRTVRAVALNRADGGFTDRQRDVLALTRVQLTSTLERLPTGGGVGLRLSPDVGWAPLTDVACLGEHGPARTAAAAVDIGRLSERERAVAALVAEGHTDAQIARRLGLAPATVSSHLRRTYARLGLANRAGLTAAWIAQAGDRWHDGPRPIG